MEPVPCVGGQNSVDRELGFLGRSYCHDSYFKPEMLDKEVNSLDSLEQNISIYTNLDSIKGSGVLSQGNIKFFEDALKSRDDALGCLYALIFYTDTGYGYANLASAIEAGKQNQVIGTENFKSDNYASILYYLILALNQI